MADQQNNRPSPYLDENHEPHGKPETQPNPNDGNNQFRPNALDEQALKTARSQTTFAFIAGPLSLFVGGMLLGTIGAICAFLAYRKLHSLAQKSNDTASIARGNAQVHADRIDYLLGSGNAQRGILCNYVSRNRADASKRRLRKHCWQYERRNSCRNFNMGLGDISRTALSLA